MIKWNSVYNNLSQHLNMDFAREYVIYCAKSSHQKGKNAKELLPTFTLTPTHIPINCLKGKGDKG